MAVYNNLPILWIYALVHNFVSHVFSDEISRLLMSLLLVLKAESFERK